jgi:hypothetical protein
MEYKKNIKRNIVEIKKFGGKMLRTNLSRDGGRGGPADDLQLFKI